MDIKLKNNRKTRSTLAVLGILVITIITTCFFPAINQAAGKRLARMSENAELEQELDTTVLDQLYTGCYVLYMEAMQREGATTASEVYLEASYPQNDEEKASYVNDLVYAVDDTMDMLSGSFENYRAEIDYCIRRQDGTYEKNTSQPLEQLFSGVGKETENQLIQHYSIYFVLHFDENGILTTEPLYGDNVDADMLIKAMGQLTREYDIWGNLREEYGNLGITCSMKEPSGIDIVYAIPRTGDYQLVSTDYENSADYWTILRVYAEEGGQLLYLAALVMVVVLVFVMTSSKIWKCDIELHRPGNWYLMEAACIGVLCVLCLGDSFFDMLYKWSVSIENIRLNQTSGGMVDAFMDLAVIDLGLFCIYGIWYLSIRFIRPVFALGVREYIREYSFFYQIFPWIKKQWEKFKHEVNHIDFSKNSIKTIIKLVVINFVVLALCSTMWFFGILMLVIYSVILFFIIENYYSKVQFYYQALLRGVNRMAEGDLDTEITEDFGMFEPVKGELAKVRTGFKKAVDEEVKSQRMKTELITNVSHDLKTPLTAITTYVELLKKEDITEEERRSYIDILERKSLRLKVLVEDLFEVSKATSNNIKIDLMDVDVINLMKQVSVEHAEKFAEMGLDLRWNVPEEKVILALDNQKSYRVFENLFVNIQKYAMPHSRVYIDLKQENGQVEITMKNMSAMELNVRPDELTERFVRGDASRNTEGSGLGLAIAKSFTEAQGGYFRVEVDGDLFKVVIVFKA
ncbi:MAG: sensor histidine kinase [Clostridiales bacterium]|nr:sensor histidine kinase [Roseburia sp.]MDD7637588.1 sensor histidine kinase [Clostridiales bacterium]MDY4112207.1 sensor histidine kinase [Roseburia sp.]